MSNATQQVDRDVWYRMHQTLIAARDNTGELLEDHIARLGSDTKKNRFIADMFEKELREINDLLDYTTKNNGVPF